MLFFEIVIYRQIQIIRNILTNINTLLNTKGLLITQTTHINMVKIPNNVTILYLKILVTLRLFIKSTINC